MRNTAKMIKSLIKTSIHRVLPTVIALKPSQQNLAGLCKKEGILILFIYLNRTTELMEDKNINKNGINTKTPTVLLIILFEETVSN